MQVRASKAVSGRGEAAPRAPRRTGCVGTAAFALAMLCASGARADDEGTEFGIAQTRYEQGKLEVAATLFRTLLDPKAPPCTKSSATGGCSLRDPELIERSRAFYAASLIASAGKDGLPIAREQILQIYLDNPAYQPNPAMFPAEVIDEFTRVRGDHKEEIDAAAKRKADAASNKGDPAVNAAKDAYIKELEGIVSQETVVDRNSRWLAMLPFGVGQFQNGDTGWGIAFLSGEVLAGGVSIVTDVAAAKAISDRAAADQHPTSETGEKIDKDALSARRDTYVAINRVAFITWAVITAGGIIHAQATFVPERASNRPRPLPLKAPKPTARPTASWAPGGATVGLVGRF